jgi:hypothetical protein
MKKVGEEVVAGDELVGRRAGERTMEIVGLCEVRKKKMDVTVVVGWTNEGGTYRV